jgi:glycosyltransferase involved in cell wall biosynthesis
VKILLYFRTHLNAPENMGVVQKCKHLADAFRAHGAEADTIFFGDNGLVFNEINQVKSSLSTKKGSLVHLFSFYLWSDKQLLKICQKTHYDALYIRHLPCHPRFLNTLRALKKAQPKLKILLEFPTWPYDAEMSGVKQQAALCLDRLLRGQMHKYVDYAITNTSDKTILEIPCLFMSNGIGAEQIPKEVSEQSLIEGQPLQLLFVGNISKWHGLDRVIKGLVGQSPKTVQLNIIGDGSEKENLRSLVQSLDLQRVVHFFPPMHDEELNAHYTKTHLAIGSLGLHRIGLSEGVPLKHREYCANGIPFVYSCEDADFTGFWGALKVSANDEIIPFEVLIIFYQSLQQNQPTLSEDMRTYAINHLTWEALVGMLLGKLDEK